MDPNAAYRELAESMRDGDLDGARVAFFALSEWVGRGGFLPSVDTATFWKTMSFARRLIRAGRDARRAVGA
jgi:hypothetical protein